MINRFKRWYKWQKNCLNHPFYKFLVLIGLAKSPTFHIFSSIEKSMLAHPELTIKYREDKPDV